MNVLLVNHYANLPTAAGGTRHFSFAKELVRRGHRVTIVASSYNHKARKETRRWQGEEYQTDIVDGIRFVWLKTPPYTGNTSARVWNMAAFAHRVLRLGPQAFGFQPNIVYASSPHLFAAWSAHRVARRLRVPFVLEIRDLWPESLVMLGGISRRHPFIILLDRLERYLYRNANHIINLLPAAADFMESRGAESSRITWIPNGIDLTIVPEPTPPSQSDSFVIMYAGTHGLANRLDLVLDAAATLQTSQSNTNVMFRLVGDGPEKPRLIARAEEMRLTNVFFDDPVPKASVYQTLGEADCFLLTLDDSPLFQWGISPNKLFDYMAAARPVILTLTAPFSREGGVPSGVFSITDDPGVLVETIRKVSEMEPDERRRLGMAVRRYVEGNHAIEVLVDKLENIFLEQGAEPSNPL